MGILRDLKNKYRTVSIVGMSKNAGKTTALNYFIEQAMDEDMVLGITSTGRDGESTDLVSGTDKPKVYLDEGTLVSVPTQLYDLAEGGIEILKRTRFRSSIGEILLCRVVDSGYVQIAGPVANQDTKDLCEEMFDYGAELVLVDGAIDRKTIASPDTSDAIILSSGAVISRKMSRVVAETAHVVALYSLPVVTDLKLRSIIEEIEHYDKVTIIGEDDYEMLENLKTGLNSSREINAAIKEDTKYVYVPGAFTRSVIAEIPPAKRKRIKFILKDPTKIFLDSLSFLQETKRGLRLEVMENIEVAAVTVNPVAPQGYSFDHQELLDAMREAIPDIPVVDVKL